MATSKASAGGAPPHQRKAQRHRTDHLPLHRTTAADCGLEERTQTTEGVVVGIELDGGQRIEAVQVEAHVAGVVDHHAPHPDETVGEDALGG